MGKASALVCVCCEADSYFTQGMITASVLIYLALAESYKYVRRRIEQKGQDKRMMQITTVDPRFVNDDNDQGNKRRALNRGEKAV